tara:strand:- start:19 stop:375 length:357 start_codon:yes stop_codon:yes gene_type:complete
VNRIEKPWGFEELIEVNEKYMMKKLKMNKGNMCSLQYHEKKRETLYVLQGQLKVYMGNKQDDLKQIIMNPSDTLTLKPFIIHRMEAIEDSIYLEASTPELNDVVRLKDEYGREGTSDP